MKYVTETIPSWAFLSSILCSRQWLAATVMIWALGIGFGPQAEAQPVVVGRKVYLVYAKRERQLHPAYFVTYDYIPESYLATVTNNGIGIKGATYIQVQWDVKYSSQPNTVLFRHDYGVEFLDLNELVISNAISEAPQGILKVTPSNKASEQTKVQWSVE
jgi:hypothetical protein